MEMIAVDPFCPVNPRVVSFHRAQELGTPGSRVHPVSWSTDPLFGAVSSRDPVAVPDALLRWATVLDAAYGYEVRPDHPRGVARRVPSAGALYPIELLAIGPAGAHHYSFWTRRFHRAHGVDAGAVARALGLGSDDLALIAVAVFWRTVQRYGVRGYRYCLLDAAHVTSNLISVIGELGGVRRLAVVAPSMRLARALALPRSVAVMCALTVRSAAQLSCGDCLAPGWVPPVRHAAFEEPPPLSHILQRVVSFHAQTLDDAAVPKPIGTWSVTGQAVAARRSAKAFTRAPLQGWIHAAIGDHLRRRRSVLRVGDDVLRSYGVRVRVAGASPGIERMEQDPDGSCVATATRVATPTDLSASVRALCQDQVLAGEAAYAVVTGIHGRVLRGASPAAYRDLVGEVGHLGAELGAQAVSLGVGTTTIGGFCDDAARRLVGDDDWFPIAVQLYGEPSLQGYKTDAASRVLENQTR